MTTSPNDSDQSLIIVKIDQEMEAIVPMYLNKKQQELESVEQLLKDEDFAQIEVIGHRIKGSGASYGFPDLTELGFAMEMAARDKDNKAIQASLQKIRSYLSRIQIQYIQIEH